MKYITKTDDDDLDVSDPTKLLYKTRSALGNVNKNFTFVYPILVIENLGTKELVRSLRDFFIISVITKIKQVNANYIISKQKMNSIVSDSYKDNSYVNNMNRLQKQLSTSRSQFLFEDEEITLKHHIEFLKDQSKNDADVKKFDPIVAKLYLTESDAIPIFVGSLEAKFNPLLFFIWTVLGVRRGSNTEYSYTESRRFQNIKEELSKFSKDNYKELLGISDVKDRLHVNPESHRAGLNPAHLDNSIVNNVKNIINDTILNNSLNQRNYQEINAVFTDTRINNDLRSPLDELFDKLGRFNNEIGFNALTGITSNTVTEMDLFINTNRNKELEKKKAIVKTSSFFSDFIIPILQSVESFISYSHSNNVHNSLNELSSNFVSYSDRVINNLYNTFTANSQRFLDTGGVGAAPPRGAGVMDTNLSDTRYRENSITSLIKDRCDTVAELDIENTIRSVGRLFFSITQTNETGRAVRFLESLDTFSKKINNFTHVILNSFQGLFHQVGNDNADYRTITGEIRKLVHIHLHRLVNAGINNQDINYADPYRIQPVDDVNVLNQNETLDNYITRINNLYNNSHANTVYYSPRLCQILDIPLNDTLSRYGGGGNTIPGITKHEVPSAVFKKTRAETERYMHFIQIIEDMVTSICVFLVYYSFILSLCGYSNVIEKKFQVRKEDGIDFPNFCFIGSLGLVRAAIEVDMMLFLSNRFNNIQRRVNDDEIGNPETIERRIRGSDKDLVKYFINMFNPPNCILIDFVSYTIWYKFNFFDMNDIRKIKFDSLEEFNKHQFELFERY